MGVSNGNTYCDVCASLIYDPRDIIHRAIGKDGYAICGVRCEMEFDKQYKKSSAKIAEAMDKIPERKGADEQPGWKMHRWWNQTYKRKKDVWDQKKVEREFRKIQRKARRGA